MLSWLREGDKHLHHLPETLICGWEWSGFGFSDAETWCWIYNTDLISLVSCSREREENVLLYIPSPSRNCIVTLLFYAESAHHLGELLLIEWNIMVSLFGEKGGWLDWKEKLGGTTISSLSACQPTDEGIGTSQLERDAYQLIHTLHIKEFKESHAPVFTSEETPLASNWLQLVATLQCQCIWHVTMHLVQIGPHQC